MFFFRLILKGTSSVINSERVTQRDQRLKVLLFYAIFQTRKLFIIYLSAFNWRPSANCQRSFIFYVCMFLSNLCNYSASKSVSKCWSNFGMWSFTILPPRYTFDTTRWFFLAEDFYAAYTALRKSATLSLLRVSWKCPLGWTLISTVSAEKLYVNSCLWNHT